MHSSLPHLSLVPPRRYCRRQWSLAEQDHLRYQQLGAFDRALMELDDKYQFLRCAVACLENTLEPVTIGAVDDITLIPLLRI
jgi:hypothetical protein